MEDKYRLPPEFYRWLDHSIRTAKKAKADATTSEEKNWVDGIITGLSDVKDGYPIWIEIMIEGEEVEHGGFDNPDRFIPDDRN